MWDANIRKCMLDVDRSLQLGNYSLAFLGLLKPPHDSLTNRILFQHIPTQHTPLVIHPQVYSGTSSQFDGSSALSAFTLLDQLGSHFF